MVVVGETPYAEGYGDVGGPGWPWDAADHGVPRPSQTMQLSAADKAAVDKVCAAAKRCVEMLFLAFCPFCPIRKVCIDFPP